MNRQTLSAALVIACLTLMAPANQASVPLPEVDLLFSHKELVGPASNAAELLWQNLLNRAEKHFGTKFNLASSMSGRHVIATCANFPPQRCPLLWVDWRGQAVELSKYKNAIFVSDRYIQARGGGDSPVIHLLDVKKPDVPIVLPPGLVGMLGNRLQILDDGRWAGLSRKGVLVGHCKDNELVLDIEIPLDAAPRSLAWTRDGSFIVVNMVTEFVHESELDYRAIVISSARREIVYEIPGYFLWPNLHLPDNMWLATAKRSHGAYLVHIAEDEVSRSVKRWPGSRQGRGPIRTSPSGQFVLGREQGLGSFVIGGSDPLVVRAITGKDAKKVYPVPNSSHSGWLVWSDPPVVQ